MTIVLIMYCTVAIKSLVCPVGLAADVGALQRLPRIVGNHSFVREICMTARNVDAEEARREGIVSGTVYEDKDRLVTLISEVCFCQIVKMMFS